MAVFIRWILFLMGISVSASATDRLEDMFYVEYGDADDLHSQAWNDTLDGSAIKIDNTTNSVVQIVNLDLMVGLEANGNCNHIATPVVKSYTLNLPAAGAGRLHPYPAALKTLVTASNSLTDADCVKYTISNAGYAIGGSLSPISGYYKMGNDATDYTSFSAAASNWKRFFQIQNKPMLLSLGTSSSCVLFDGGTSKCWGENGDNELGDGGTTDSSVPVNATTPTAGSLGYAVGGSFACAIKSDKTVECWGDGDLGQLGNGATDNSSTAVAVSTITSVHQITAGLNFACALETDGDIHCWGHNAVNQIGNGNTTNQTSPVDITPTGKNLVDISAGAGHACAVEDDGDIYCWGEGILGTMGDGADANNTTPSLVSTIDNAVDVECGATLCCARLQQGKVNCWGAGTNGQLGDGLDSNSNTPVEVSGYDAVTPAVQIAVQGLAACALDRDGAVKCWGEASHVGDSTDTERTAPRDVTGLTSGVVQIAAGTDHFCAIKDSGAIVCWGENTSGNLGDNSTTDRNAPVDVSTLDGKQTAYVQIGGGLDFTCGLTAFGTVQCWGEGLDGRLGNGGTTDSTTPVDVLNLTDVTQLSVGYDHSCALHDTGRVSCWGQNDRGQLGDDSITDRSTPVTVQAVGGGGELTDIVHIGVNRRHSCAVNSSGAVHCWGVNDYGELGDKTTTDRHTPVNVIDHTSGISKVATSYRTTCVLSTPGGAVNCWGYNASGQIGDATTTHNNASQPVSGLTSGVIDISGSRYTFCALKNDETVSCWGANGEGQLGDNTTTSRSTPVAVQGAAGVQAIAVGRRHVCGLLEDNTVKCWGSNDVGEIGDGTTTDRHTAVAAIGIAAGQAAFIGAGEYHSCMIDFKGLPWCWGENTFGAFGDGNTADSSTPLATTGLSAARTGIKQVVMGEDEACALSKAGTVKCWGENPYSELGDGTTTQRLKAVYVHTSNSDSSPLSNIDQIAVGRDHACSLSAANAVQCWGRNSAGQIGDSSTTTRATPVAITALQDSQTAVKIATGESFSCALTSAKNVQCWGDNSDGQLGNNNFPTTSTSAGYVLDTDGVGNLAGLIDVAAGWDHACALSNAGKVYCWGDNDNGQLGNDDKPNDTQLPVEVLNLGSLTPTKIYAYNQNSCVLLAGGQFQCWGNNSNSQIGDGGTTDAEVPTSPSNITLGVAELGVGGVMTCARFVDGSLQCWGSNGNGAVGDGTTTNRSTPVAVHGMSKGVTSISAGQLGTCAVLGGRSVWCWGRGDFGALGDNDGSTQINPYPRNVLDMFQ